MAGRRRETLRKRELTAREVRRDMASGAGLAYENAVSTLDEGDGRRRRILWRLERHQVNADRVEDLVSVAHRNTALLWFEDVVIAELHRVRIHDERGVAGNVFGTAQSMRTSRVDVLAVTECVEIRRLGGVIRAAVPPVDNANADRRFNAAAKLDIVRISNATLVFDPGIGIPRDSGAAPGLHRARVAEVEERRRFRRRRRRKSG